MRVINATDKRKSNPVARKGKQKVFKQIEILGSDDDNSEDEEDYVPPKNYEVSQASSGPHRRLRF